MKDYIIILFNPLNGIKNLIENDNGDLIRSTNLLFLLSSVMPFISGFFTKGDITPLAIMSAVVSLLIGSAVRFAFSKFVFSRILHWTGKKLGGKSELVHNQFIYSLSLLPTVILFPVYLLQGYLFLHPDEVILNYTLNGLSYAMQLWTLVILTSGLYLINDFKMEKAFLNALPVFLISLVSALVGYINIY